MNGGYAEVSLQWAEAIFADPALRSRFEAMVRETEGREPVRDDLSKLPEMMATTGVTCGNCGAVGDELTWCQSIWTAPHTHPRDLATLTPEPCHLGLCRRCVRLLRRNLRAKNNDSSPDGAA